MRRLTDLSLETISLDGHASALLQKRLNRLSALDWELIPAEGIGIDDARAEDYAGIVRENLNMIPNFRQKIVDVGWAAYHGRSAQELGWHFNRRYWCVKDMYWIHPRRLSFGPNRDLRVVDLRTDRGGFEDIGFPIDEIPYKFLSYTPRLFGDYPEREGLAPRTLYWSFFSRFGVRERMKLLEIFGAPWRIVMPKTGADIVPPTTEQLDEAYDAINALGNAATAQLPVGMDVQIPQPATNAGQVHGEAITHAQETMSKLYLGQTGTTDAVSTGLGSSIGDVHLSEEDLIIAADARGVSEAIEDSLTDAIIVVNFGPDAVTHAPTFRIRTDPPMDRKAEAELAKAALEVGLQVAEADVRERIGYREIRDDDKLLVLPDVAPAPMFSAAEKPLVSLPTAETDSVELAGDDLPPDDSRDVLAAKMTELGIAKCEHQRPNRCPQCGVERVRDVEIGKDGEPVWSVAWRPIGGSALPVAPVEGVDGEEDPEVIAARASILGNHKLAGVGPVEKDPTTIFGSPETLIERGVKDGAAQTGKLVAAIVASVGGKKTAKSILTATRAAINKFNRADLEKSIEREFLQTALLGALDADWEGNDERAVKVETFTDLWPDTILLAPVEPPFANHPLEKALGSFIKREVVTRPVFDQMVRSAKARAFTVAGAVEDEVLATVQAELASQLHLGTDLRNFKTQVKNRLESAGWTPVNPSHVETVYRTNLATAYNDGRFAQVTDPLVQELRPYLQMMTATDSRVRPNHRQANGLIFRTEEIERANLPPWHYNCRCRFRSLSERQLSGQTISPVSTLSALQLPAPGWV